MCCCHLWPVVAETKLDVRTTTVVLIVFQNVEFVATSHKHGEGAAGAVVRIFLACILTRKGCCTPSDSFDFIRQHTQDVFS